jgi:hypothetical protein
MVSWNPSFHFWSLQLLDQSQLRMMRKPFHPTRSLLEVKRRPKPLSTCRLQVAFVPTQKGHLCIRGFPAGKCQARMWNSQNRNMRWQELAPELQDEGPGFHSSRSGFCAKTLEKCKCSCMCNF